MSRTHEARARESRFLIREALAVVDALSDARIAELGPHLDIAAARKDLRQYAEQRPRCVLTAFAKEPRVPRA
ncbi:hypothetical protein [Lysobacter antibioticus]|uniref:Uncharacterized protein n=1 Tax=Lysobacter antibioticus TaxID=84531 RepID=A0A0S2F7M4_LYSAN|nr:hypothetical protein [Lysobacter antibioticus]ALN79473.1 hypothetical protein LA76x_1316 [Lysobacter antibioticus]